MRKSSRQRKLHVLPLLHTHHEQMELTQSRGSGAEYQSSRQRVGDDRDLTTVGPGKEADNRAMPNLHRTEDCGIGFKLYRPSS